MISQFGGIVGARLLKCPNCPGGKLDYEGGVWKCFNCSHEYRFQNGELIPIRYNPKETKVIAIIFQRMK